MRFSIIAVAAAFSSTVLAQGLLDQIPKCAQTCFGGNLGTCGISDIACICGSKAIDSVSCCVFATCSQSEIAATTQFAVQLCKLQNINVNTQPSCPSGSATPSAGSASMAPSGSVSMAPSGSVSMASSGSASMTSSGSASPTSGGASRTSASAAATGAAPYQTAGAGVGLGIAIFGLLAAL